MHIYKGLDLLKKTFYNIFLEISFNCLNQLGRIRGRSYVASVRAFFWISSHISSLGKTLPPQKTSVFVPVNAFSSDHSNEDNIEKSLWTHKHNMLHSYAHECSSASYNSCLRS